ncbi:MAG: PD-(D/E)XK nuclease family protein [Desulfovibrio sp.]|jgi:hypothetical protein|nr:PD-(D/E)XK nuclease family protein [Desulfovibrio sp.]
MKGPFTVIAWERDFLRDLLDLALEDTEGDLSRAFFIFPYARPVRYLTLLLREDRRVRKPLIMPRMLTISELCAELFRIIEPHPLREAGLLDRAGLLLACVREETQAEGPGFKTEASEFFPWGLRLANLFEECFAQRVVPDNFLYAQTACTAEGEGTDAIRGQDALFSPGQGFAPLLLARLGRIFVRYKKLLEEGGYSSKAYMAARAASYIEERAALPDNFPPGFLGSHKDAAFRPRVYIAGFHMLTRSEDIILRRIRDDLRARVVVRADSALTRADSEESLPHWSCLTFRDWAKSWQSGFELFFGAQRPGARHERQILYCAGYDLHSQLQVLREEVAENIDPPGAEDSENAADLPAHTAVILPAADLLPPVLHHLPGTDINISLGYPLSRSPLFRLLDTVARLRENARNGLCHWRDLVDLIRHPYIKTLSLSGEEAAEIDEPFRRMLRRLDMDLRGQGRKFTDPAVLLEETRLLLMPEETPPAPVFDLLNELFRSTISAFQNLSTPAELAGAVEGLCQLLDRRDPQLRRRFPIDAECLYRLRFSLLPALKGSALAGEKFTTEALFSLLRSLLEAERVPFEAEPLVGLQVMGMLESRLLSFKRVILIDAVEDNLPGAPVGDPLLPDVLRQELGLPSLHSREQLAAHTFFSLIKGAEKVLLLWQEGEEAGLQGGKKKKSRFVEELLWAEEQKMGRLLSGRDAGSDEHAKCPNGPLRVLSAKIQPVAARRRDIKVDEPVRALLRKLLSRPISASFLDDYLRCPAQFFYTRLAGIKAAPEVNEGDDPLAVGNLWHQVLRDFYERRLHTDLSAGKSWAKKDRAELQKALFASSEYAGLEQRLPADSKAMLRAACAMRLESYLDLQPPTRVLAVEMPLNVSFLAPFTQTQAGSGDGRKKGRGGDVRNAPGAAPHPGFSLAGHLDRLDLRPAPLNVGSAGETESIVILDYKSGLHLPGVNAKLWEDSSFWKRLRAWKATDEDQNPLAELGMSLQSVQLPFYLLLYSLAAGQGVLPAALSSSRSLPALNAAWVELADKGEEKFLFPGKFSLQKNREIIENQLPELLDFLLRHMLTSLNLKALPGRHCDWCSVKKLCIVAQFF